MWPEVGSPAQWSLWPVSNASVPLIPLWSHLWVLELLTSCFQSEWGLSELTEQLTYLPRKCEALSSKLQYCQKKNESFCSIIIPSIIERNMFPGGDWSLFFFCGLLCGGFLYLLLGANTTHFSMEVMPIFGGGRFMVKASEQMFT
jgi:hypothetical protein